MPAKTPESSYAYSVQLPDHQLDPKVPNGYLGSLSVRLTYKSMGGFRSIHLKKHIKPLLTLSISGDTKYQGSRSGGQCVKEIREIWGHIPDVAELCDLWERWHLNDMRAGTKAQMEIVRNLRKCPVSSDWYTWACFSLKSHGLLEDHGYTFGREWLFEVIPATVVKRIKVLVRKINRGS
jgi:hypothetical protein